MLVTIYQIKNIEKCDYAFQGWKFAKDKFSLSDYECVYSFFVERENSGISTDNEKRLILDKTFEWLNMSRPAEFTGHSLSVSDVVMLGTEIYYCDSFGWEKVA